MGSVKPPRPLQATSDHAFRTPLTTILGLSEILQTELFGPLNSRYKKYAADICASAAELQNLIRSSQVAGPSAKEARLPRLGQNSFLLRADIAPIGAAATVPQPGRLDNIARRPDRLDNRESSFADLIGYAYEAGAEPERWPHFLKELRLRLNAESATLLLHDRRSGRCRPVHTSTADGGRETDAFPNRAAIDENVIKERMFVAPGSVWSDVVIVGRKAQPPQNDNGQSKNSPYFLHSLRGLIERSHAEVAFVSVLRRHTAGPFGRDEIVLLERVMPHLHKAMRIHRKMGEVKGGRDALVATFDRFPLAIALVGPAGRPFHFNRRTKELFDAADGLRLANDGLYAATAQETGALRETIGSALTAAARQTHDGGGALSLSRPSGRKPLSVLILPAAMKYGTDNGHAPMAAMFVADPECRHKANESDLRRFWQLTKNEAQVASRIAQGQGVEEIAKEMGIMTNTIRTHLKHIFDKTQTEGQVELVHLIMASPASLRRD